MSFATKEQLQELVAYMASQISVPTIGIGGGFAPIGTIISYMGTTAPQDYLICDGTAYAIADYPQLADFIETQFGAVDFFGGNGTTTFAVPDLRGEFLRGTGTNSHTNQGSGENVGVHQDGTLHRTVGLNPNNDIAAIGRFPEQNLVDDGTDFWATVDAKNKASGDAYWDVHKEGTSAAGTSMQSFTSRPTNTSVLYCIKAVCAGEVYSTDERVVGTWIDGKPVYQRTLPAVTLSGIVDGTQSSFYTVATGLTYSTLDKMWVQDIFAKNELTAGSLRLNDAYSSNPTFYCRCTAMKDPNSDNAAVGIFCNRSGFNGMSVYATIRYTKTTD